MSNSGNNTIRRKLDHLEHFKNDDHSTTGSSTWLEHVHLVHNALPELDFSEIDVSTRLLGNRLESPLFISGMTGGISESESINLDLAMVADNMGIGFGLGSMRSMIESPETTGTYKVRDFAPGVFLPGNIGGTQLISTPHDVLINALDEVQANAVCVHLNPAQEILQSEGDRNFRGILEAIRRLVSAIEIPVIVKETGAGISRSVGLRLIDAGVQAIDVAGCGGTSMMEVEINRQGKAYDPDLMAIRGWGIPTAAAICDLSDQDIDLIASGGIRTGYDVARSIALGAAVAGLAAPILRAYFRDGKSGCERLLNGIINVLKISMLLTGSKTLVELGKTDFVATGPLREWISQKNNPHPCNRNW